MEKTIAAFSFALLAAAPALAHHSSSMFERSAVTVLKGTVKTFAYVQPHSWIDIIVKNDKTGEMVSWGVESGPPPNMRRMGITPSVLKAGDTITIRIHPLKDGRPMGSLIDVTLADGKTVGQTYGAAPPPDAPAKPAAPK